MKKVIPFFAACFIACLLYAGVAGCHKKKGDDGFDCKFCRAFNGDFQQKDSANVCSESEESSFRSRNTGRQIQCN